MKTAEQVIKVQQRRIELLESCLAAYARNWSDGGEAARRCLRGEPFYIPSFGRPIEDYDVSEESHEAHRPAV